MQNTNIGISPNYVSEWSIQEAIREIVQNNIDAKKEFGCDGHVKWEDGQAIVKDYGEGLEMKHLVMGISEKSNESIGQFGEGLKLALLVFAREHKKIEIWSNGKRITPNISMNDDYKTEMINLQVEDLPPHWAKNHIGTSIKFECTEDELDEGKNYFLTYYKKNTSDFEWVDKDFISLPGGNVWVNGSLVGQIDDAKFSYHLSGNEARGTINRDRGSVDTEKLSQIIVEKFGKMRSLNMMIQLFKMAKEKNEKTQYWEMGLNFWAHRIEKKNVKLWKRAYTSVMGDAVITSSDSAIDEQAKYQADANVVDLGYKWNDICKDLGIETSKKALQRKTKTKTVAQKDLNENEHNILKRAKKLIKQYYNKPGRVIIVGEFIGEPGTQGLYDPSKNVIKLDRSILSGLNDTVDTLLHECIHKHSGFSDKTIGFEREYGKVATKLMMELMKMDGEDGC